jgi:hypothetical protein
VSLVQTFCKVALICSGLQIVNPSSCESRVKTLAAFPSLQKLDLHLVRLPANWRDYLASWSKLEKLDLIGVKLSKSDVDAVSRVTNLKSLTFAKCGLDEDC